LEPGKLADIVVVDLSVPNLTPTRVDNIVENLIWAANGNEIQYVISNGQILIDDYKFSTLNVQEILQQVQELSEMFLEFKQRRTPQKTTGIRENN
jgi:5-methylthioadenosine/S-adenosylhomocysteine deaminase